MYRAVDVRPWDSTSPDTAMNRVFGAGNWSYDYYESADAAALFTPATSFIFMEGGADTDSWLNRFLAENSASVLSWVGSGGRLIIESAGWYTGVSTPFGVDLLYSGYASYTATAANPSHPIFNGPFPSGTSWEGNAFSIDALGGTGYIPLITGERGDIVGEMQYGSGLVLFSGRVTDNWDTPQPQAANLTANMIAYTSGVDPEPAPEATTFVLAGAGLVLLGVLKRPRRSRSAATPPRAPERR
ncbi:MAG: hypothetical protein ACM336_06105 [Acidobacteriota bacterium]